MALSGTLNTLSISEIFQTLARANATGVLQLISTKSACDVVFDKGLIINVIAKNEESERTLVQRLIASGVIKKEDTIDKQGAGSGGYSAVSSLIRIGKISKENVVVILKDHMLDLLYDLFIWEQASFTFFEASPDDAETEVLVVSARKKPVNISVEPVLMESARRLDEWERVKTQIPSEKTPFSPVAGAEQELSEYMHSYPYSDIIPHIDGVNSIEAIIKKSTATRFDIYTNIAYLINNQLVMPLSEEHILQNAISYEQVNDYSTSSKLYRSLLSINPNNETASNALLTSLGHIGDNTEILECYKDLSQGYLNNDKPLSAIDAAKKAVDLSSGEDLEARKILVSCYEANCDIEEHRAESILLAKHYIDLGLWNEVKEYCDKIFDNCPNDESVMHLASLAMLSSGEYIFSHSEEVLCPQCASVLKKHTKVCTNCEADLIIPCLNCKRELAVSETFCIYCGKNPHWLEFRNDAVIESSFGLDISDAFRSRIRKAIEYKDQGNYDKSLAVWKDLHNENPSDKRIATYVRELELKSHQYSVELYIEMGNKYSNSRNYYKACSMYKSAIQALTPRDPRTRRLEVMLKTASRDHKRAGLVYIVSIVFLFLAGFVIARDHLFVKNYREKVRNYTLEIKTKPFNYTTYKWLDNKHFELDKEADFNRKKVSLQLAGFLSEAERTKKLCEAQDVDLLENLYLKGDIKKVGSLLNEIKITYRGFLNDDTAKRVKEIQTKTKNKLSDMAAENKEIAEAPGIFAKAMAKYKAKELHVALIEFEKLEKSPNKKIAKNSSVWSKKLKEKKRILLKQITEAEELGFETALEKYKKIYSLAIEWRMEKKVSDTIEKTKQDQALSTKNFIKIKDTIDIAVVKEFINKNSRSKECVLAKRILGNLEKLASEKGTLFTAYQKAKDKKDVNRWHGLAKKYSSLYEDNVVFPAQILTTPVGATVYLDGIIIGETPFLWSYEKASSLTIKEAGYDDVVFTPNKPKYSISLLKSQIKEIDLGGKVLKVLPKEKGFFIAHSKGVSKLDENYEKEWAVAMAFDSKDQKIVNWVKTMSIIGDRIIYSTNTTLKTVTPESEFNEDNESKRFISIEMPISDKSIVYTNELLGFEQRIAFCSSGILQTGEWLKGVSPVNVGDCIAGPLLYNDKDMNQLLITGNSMGHIVAYNEVEKKKIWKLNLGATNINHLSWLGKNDCIMVLDESRICSVRITAKKAIKNWEYKIKGKVLDFYTKNSVCFLSTENAIMKYARTGLASEILLPKKARLATQKNKLYVFCVANEVFVYKDKVLLWKRKVDDATTLYIDEKRVLCGTKSGKLLFFGTY